MNEFNRRAFVKASAAAGAMSSINAFSIAKPTANDTELKVSRSHRDKVKAAMKM